MYLLHLLFPSVWKRGKLIRVHAHNATYDIDYDDGKADRGLSSTCVRRYVPHHPDDVVWMQSEVTNKSIRCKVVRVHIHPTATNQDELYDLVPIDDKIDGTPRIYRSVPPNRIRRIVA